MKVYIQKGKDNECPNPNFFIALDGFRQMGWEIATFSQGKQIEGHEPDNVVVGFIDDTKEALQALGIDVPAELNYPDELISFIGRKLWKSTINTVAARPEIWPVFVKPVHASKKFTGVLVRTTRDLIGCGDQAEDTEVWCAEPVKFLSEWRCFIRYGKILDVRRYRGNWRLHYDYQVIEQAVKLFTSAPTAYALDFGLTDNGQTLLVEANDGFSLGAYGLNSLDYAKLLSARWAQITGSRDYCNF